MRSTTITFEICEDCCDPCALGEEITLTLTGITICTSDCLGGLYKLTSVTGLNGVHTLTQTVENVQWEKIGGSLAYDTAFPDPDCGGAAADTGTGEIKFTLFCSEGVLTLRVHPSGTPSSSASFFVSSDIDVNVSEDNAYTACGTIVGSSESAGFDGTALLELP